MSKRVEALRNRDAAGGHYREIRLNPFQPVFRHNPDPVAALCSTGDETGADLQNHLPSRTNVRQQNGNPGGSDYQQHGGEARDQNIMFVVSVALFAYKGLWLTVGLYTVFIALSWVGWREWKRRL